MSNENNMLYVRGEENKSEDEDVWDDTALIQAYDKAVNLAKEEVAKRIARDDQSQQQTNQKSPKCYTNKCYKKWIPGTPCRAVYSVDGEIYEAIVKKIHENGLCTVQFIGYNNREKVKLSSLLESEGLESQIAQQKDALAENGATEETAESDTSGYSTHQKISSRITEKMDCETEDLRKFKFNSKNPGRGCSNSAAPNANSTIPPPPPLPPQLAKLPDTDGDALSSMLMSWYISGFHTGYYHGLQQAKLNQQKKKNCH